MKSTGKHDGFTLIETLVVISLIGLLLALIIPAVQAAREGSRRMQCSNNLRQMAIAAAIYHEQYNVFAPALTTTGRPVIYMGLYSVHSRLLPYLDQATLFNSINFTSGTVPPIRFHLRGRWSDTNGPCRSTSPFPRRNSPYSCAHRMRGASCKPVQITGETRASGPRDTSSQNSKIAAMAYIRKSSK